MSSPSRTNRCLSPSILVLTPLSHTLCSASRHLFGLTAMPYSLTHLVCSMTSSEPHSPSSKAPKPPQTTCGFCRSLPFPSLNTIRRFCSLSRNCLTLDSWPTGTERLVPPPSQPSLMPSPPTSSETSLALPPLWSANILPSLYRRLLGTLTLSVKALPPPANSPPLRPSVSLVVIEFEVYF